LPVATQGWPGYNPRMATGTPQVLTVTELTRRIKGLLEGSFPTVWVEGEISNFTVSAAGHAYFTLKDANAALSAVMFRNVTGKLTFAPADGLQVLACGPVSVYEKRGQYQIIISQLMPKGLGALQLAFEQLKQKLAKEGLFDAERKKPIPVLPQRIGLVTSPTGAAIRDFLNIIGRRYPNVHIIIHPVRVQGVGAAAEIAAAVDDFNTRQLVDVIIVMRGGGSLEDLWAFNEEPVARALARSTIPTISAVGHEVDFTISDFVADLRAPTPSAAAELVVRAKDEFLALIAQNQKRLDQELRLRLSEARRRLAACVVRHPADMVRQYQQRVDDLAHRLRQASLVNLQEQRNRLAGLRLLTPQMLLQRTKHRLAQAQTRLELLSPKGTLSRGYSITRHKDTGKVVRRVADVLPGTKLSTIVLDGEFGSVVN
jgi:exodeoxyribonuclease VII large subunit